MAKTPVVFVPGLGGSFNLLVLLDWSAPTLSGWNFPPFVDYGKNFVDTFTLAGYTRDSDLFVAFYDWRKSVVDSATNYLMPWIDRARKASGSDKVILVGHSMGGLVARSYIQSDAYRGDVERLITLGTPHRGSADAYYPWEGGAMNWDAVANAVFGVYLWYLEHAHPFQSELNRLNTIRTQAPGVRDLLPLFDYLQSQGGAQGLTSCQKMLERNLLGDLLLAPAGLERLLTRTPLTTIAGSGFVTIQSIVVGSPPAPPDRPPLFVDGAPASTTTTGSGDGTVLLISAVIDDPRVRNLPPVQVVHDGLPDKAVAQVLTELNVPVPAVVAVPASQPRLVILTASPLELTVEPPAAAPAVLSEAGPAARPRQRSVKGKNYGHRGKRLNMAIIPAPAAGTYNVRLRGTATGTFALGVLLVGAGDQAASAAPVTLGEASEGVPAKIELISPIDTVHGQVAAETELRYQVVLAPEAAPRVRFDAEATTRDAVARLSAAAAAPGPMVLGDESAPPQMPAVLSAAEAPDEVRSTVTAALVEGDAGAVTRLAALLAAADAATFELLRQVAEQVVAPRNRALALGLLEQLRQVAVLGAGA